MKERVCSYCGVRLGKVYYANHGRAFCNEEECRCFEENPLVRAHGAFLIQKHVQTELPFTTNNMSDID